MSADALQTTLTFTAWSCQRCGHKWIPRKPERPRRCPKCTDPNWDRAEVRKYTRAKSKKRGR